MSGFIKAIRSDEADFLNGRPIENHMLNVIARRARRTPCNLNGLEVGECFIGHKGLGITEQQYRTAKKNLTKWGLVKFKSGRRVTDRGTVAKLLNTKIYDINEIDTNGRVTEEQRKGNGRVTTNKECNNDKNEENSLVEQKPDKKKNKFSDEQYKFANAMFERIKNVVPNIKNPNLESWANTIRLLNENDGVNLRDAWRVFTWANSDDFWQANILSADKFRKQYAQLSAKAPNQQPTQVRRKEFKV